MLVKGVKTITDRLAALRPAHEAAGLAPAAGAPESEAFFFTMDEAAAFLELYWPERPASVRGAALHSAQWTDCADGTPRLHFCGVLRLVAQMQALRSASDAAARSFFKMCG